MRHVPARSRIVASVAGYLMSRWLQEARVARSTESSPVPEDRILCALLLLASEHPNEFKTADFNLVEECWRFAKSGTFGSSESVPWQAIYDLMRNGKLGPEVQQAFKRHLGHFDSTARELFHYYGWMVRQHLDPEVVTMTLLRNIASTLDSVMESAGLLSGLYTEKAVLDALADEFDAEDYKEQYTNRLDQIRKDEWNLNSYNLRLAESDARRSLFETALILPMRA